MEILYVMLVSVLLVGTISVSSIYYLSKKGAI